MTTRIKSISQHVEALKDLFGAHPADVNISKVIAYIETLKTPIQYPKRPFLAKYTHDLEELDAYRDKLAEYEIQMKACNDLFSKRGAENAFYNEIITAYIKDVSGLNEFVPAERRNKVYNLAYEKGHRNGLYEIYYFLVDFVNLFKD